MSNVATTAFEPLQLIKIHSLSVETISFQDRESRVLFHIEYPFQPPRTILAISSSKNHRVRTVSDQLPFFPLFFSFLWIGSTIYSRKVASHGIVSLNKRGLIGTCQNERYLRVSQSSFQPGITVRTLNSAYYKRSESSYYSTSHI